eukprot:8634651-Pyramimonas_sp.AAC.1
MGVEASLKSLSSKDLNNSAECTLLGHIIWIRQMLAMRVARSAQSRDARDAADHGHAKGSIERDLLLQ